MEWLPKLRARYQNRHREGKNRMLDELCANYDYERKYAIKLLRGTAAVPSGRPHPSPERLYVVIEPVVRQMWLTAEQPCGTRLASILRLWLPYYERRYGGLNSRQRKLLRSSARPPWIGCWPRRGPNMCGVAVAPSRAICCGQRSRFGPGCGT